MYLCFRRSKQHNWHGNFLNQESVVATALMFHFRYTAYINKILHDSIVIYSKNIMMYIAHKKNILQMSH